MTRILPLLLICLLTGKITANTRDSLLVVLENTISQKDVFFRLKMNKIARLKQEQVKINPANLRELFLVNLKLYNEYESFIYDSAYNYVSGLQQTAYALQDKNLIAISRVKLGFVLLSSGMFKEALDSLFLVNPRMVPDSIRRDYYSVVARTYFDLADYNNDGHFSRKYKKIGNQYLDSAIQLVQPNSCIYWSFESLRRMKLPNREGARQSFEYWISHFKLDDHQLAIASSSLGYIYSLDNNREKAIEYLILASVADIRASTKETVALRNLANLLYQDGDASRAYRYIKMSLDEAIFYNARHRKIEIAAILPLIEGERLATVEAQKRKLIGFIIAISISALLIIVFLFIIYIQLNKIKKVRRILQLANQNLQNMNGSLTEANRIKEEYIGYFFSINSEYIDKIDAFQKAIHRKIIARQFDDLDHLVKNSDLKRERENLFINFDKIFLKLFPHFVKEFNSLFREEDHILLKKDELLNADLRIYALMRLGIKDNEKIAKFLNYSVTTIYTYKTRLKSKSIFKEQFEEKVMHIQAG